MLDTAERVGVLDVGCFSAHLVVVEAGRGSLRKPVRSHKVRLRLDKTIDRAGRIGPAGIDAVVAAVGEAVRREDVAALDTFVPFGTSSIRDATNVDDVLRQVALRTGVELALFSGRQEARLAYLAARRWFGWSAGALTVLDVGGGTVELAAGDSDRPRFAASLPLGARTLTTMGLGGGDRLDEQRADVLASVRSALGEEDLALVGAGRAVGCSKVFQQLAHLAGAPVRGEGRRLRVADLQKWIPRLAALSERGRARLPGISRHRAAQSLAGAVAAEALMLATGHDAVDISPWSTKEGLLLSLLEHSPETSSVSAA